MPEPPPTAALTRRDFLGSCAAAWLAGPSLLPRSDGPGRFPFPVGIQLYSVRNSLDHDFEGTLAALGGIGYREVEFAGLHGHEAGPVRRMLDRYHLRATSGHYDLSEITDKIDETIATARTLGHRFVICPWLDEDNRTRDGYARMADIFNRAGERFRRAGFGFGYHNHQFEFTALPGGGPGVPATGYDILLARTDPDLVKMELDLYWVRKGGGDALDYFHRFPHRFRLVHVKDMGTDGSMVDVGAGVIDWSTLLRAARTAGVRHYFVEHDDPKDELAFARVSYQYLAGLTL
ncbi:MAG TPA: sugar phosphate isomerase/epimerase [Gemmatimonadales bacterium]|nr:sugar phosphate isomerase/epimerase [Gemmatimonadales bacterium]